MSSSLVQGSSEDRINKRINKVLDTKLEKDTLEAFQNLSTFFEKKNTLQNRRNLRSQVEKRSVAINDSFLKVFRGIKLSLDAVCKDLDTLVDSVKSMKNDLESSKALTQDLIRQTNSLQEERDRVEIHKQIAEAFVGRFQLSVPEHLSLYGSNKDDFITPEFFDVLDKVQSISADSKTLMQCGFPTCASDIMEEMALHLEGAFERLYRWTQNHCRNLDNEIGSTVIKAMGRLQERPLLFK